MWAVADDGAPTLSPGPGTRSIADFGVLAAAVIVGYGGRVIDDFYRNVHAGRHFWIDAPAAPESLRHRPDGSTASAQV